ncbi:SDR family NAD(P)-dependent oxidoreductase [Alteromonas sp. a30]|uniref:SDR family NAD(P)-dependent oxidoreductase n=1 Tax=Alteromonas sp. a30 TaxID=2730917 RepID=UPI00227F1FF2|nr:SDR family NAD(P)-dependent oxidoreductase [Alteromonas sp. a30]MCY7294523.1 SDR family oxidoreductase [Alteromonas sp. a30]
MILQGKTILVTGAYTGIGLATAKYCLAEGARVFANVKEEHMVGPTYDALSGEAEILQYDVADAQSVRAAFAKIEAQTHSTLDGLVNNAGIFREESFLETSLEQFSELLDVNVKATFFHSQLATKLMLPKKSGSIVNMCSYVGTHGAAFFAAYASTKGCLASMTKSIAKEVGADNIRVNGVAPGFIASNMTAHYQDEIHDMLMTNVAMARPGQPLEVASAVGFLLSEQASYISGQILEVDGAAFF